MPDFETPPAAAFIIIDTEGNRTRQEVNEYPFRIGRQSGNQLLIRDARASRNHAQLNLSGGEFILEDLASRHGVTVNGERVDRKALQDGDKIEFGFEGSFALIFERSGSRVTEIAQQLTGHEITTRTGAEGGLARLRAVLEIGRALETSFSIDAVLTAVVDAALVITHAERGFLLLKNGVELGVRCARDRHGTLRDSDLAVPRNMIQSALEERANTLSMQFKPDEGDPASSVYTLALRSVLCIPLVRLQLGPEKAGTAESTGTAESAGEAVGVLYLDSRVEGRDMAAGNRELLETLAIEASTVLENARLLEEERAHQRMNEELAFARQIQQGLLPRHLPSDGWFRATGFSTPARHVGGDYYDVFQLSPDSWFMVVADVAGKGVSSALVASLLQGAFLAVNEGAGSIGRALRRVNEFFHQRADSSKHATLFCATIGADGGLSYINAGHCAPLLLSANGHVESLEATSVPVGLVEGAAFELTQRSLAQGDRLVVYTDGLTEARDAKGDFFSERRLVETASAHPDVSGGMLHQFILDAVDSFTIGQEFGDDLTLLVIEYCGQP